jgi:hypothetical protein
VNAFELIVLLLLGGVGSFYVAIRRTDPAQRSFRDYARSQGLAPEDAGNSIDVINHGRRVQLRLVRTPDLATWVIDVRANVLVRPGLRLVRRRHWQGNPLPRDLAPEIWDLPVVREDAGSQTRTDRPDALDDLGELEEAWRIVEKHLHSVVLASDGTQVLGRVEDTRVAPSVLEAVIDAVAILARWDDGLSRTLAELAGAPPACDGELDPAVSLDPDDLRLGVWKGRVSIARLDGVRAEPAIARVESGAVAVTTGVVPTAALPFLGRAGDGELTIEPGSARFTWRDIERDPAHLRAAVDALRAATTAAEGPYR